jgi:hypothetical protein
MSRDITLTAIMINGQAANDGRVAAVYRCRLQLDELKATDHADIKFCEQCKQKVFRVVDFEGFEKAVAAKGCVWGPVDIRAPEGLAKERLFVGGAGFTYESTRSRLTWED